MFTRIRPGFIEYQFKKINVETFDLEKELVHMRLEIQAPWNGTMTQEKAENMTTPKSQRTQPKQELIQLDMTF